MYCECWVEENRLKSNGTEEGLKMDRIPTPPDLFHPALPDANIKPSQQGGWFCTHHNKKIRTERSAMSRRGKTHTYYPEMRHNIGWGGGLRLINFSSTTHHIDIVSLFVSSCGSNRFILQTIPCSVDRRMDSRLHSCCLLRLHFCLGI